MVSASEAFAAVSALARRETGMIYDEGKEYLVEARLQPLANKAGCSFADYVTKILADPVERAKAMDALTINETSWFRDNAPYQAFTDVMLPDLIQARSATRRIRVWSAASSSGQEAYSIAMLLDQHLPPGWTSEIVASDYSPTMLDRVRAGRYTQVEMNRGLPATLLVKYFSRVGIEWEVAPHLRDMVTVRSQNLTAPFLGLGTFDLILLRNVLIYFEKDVRHDILRRMLPMLNPGGYFLIGSSETTLDSPPALAAAWQREQIGRVQVHRVAPAFADRPTAPIAASLTGA
ncbi:CheR family methyltransferase [Nocardioides stalactiti]|uniref:CheR family methyltransferase n=1 Tax=Nocardioides stalactiti TaxID=2755356 RepID=UPI0016035A47|nr:protein-glutamate O-methyltransferase CheR [Nocardioides stalactiti]